MDDALFDPYLEEDYQGYEEGQTIRIPVKPTVVKVAVSKPSSEKLSAVR